MPVEFDPNTTLIKRVMKSRTTFNWMVVLGGIGTIGGALLAINAFTGLNLRPAWGFEVDKLQQQQMRIEQIIERSSQQVEHSARNILNLNRKQIELRIKQIEFDRREARRELTEFQVQAEKYRSEGHPVPGFINVGISDTRERLHRLDEEKKDAQARLLQLQ